MSRLDAMLRLVTIVTDPFGYGVGMTNENKTKISTTTTYRYRFFVHSSCDRIISDGISLRFVDDGNGNGNENVRHK